MPIPSSTVIHQHPPQQLPPHALLQSTSPPVSAPQVVGKGPSGPGQGHFLNWVYLTLGVNQNQAEQQKLCYGTAGRNACSLAPTSFSGFSSYYNPMASGISCLRHVLNSNCNGLPSRPSATVSIPIPSIGELTDQFEDLSLNLPCGRQQKVPPATYVCHLCALKGHYIEDCPKALCRNDGLTPYQGKKRCFGEYKCLKCKRKWMSGNSWANMGQECIKCRINVYPHKQRPLENPQGLDVSDQSKVHPQHLCQKCMMLGFYCRRRPL